MRDAINHPGVKMLFQKLNELSETMTEKQINLDPYTQQGEIKRAQEFRFIVKKFFPQIIEGLVNYDPEAPDKQVAPKRRWSICAWFTTAFGQKASTK